MAKNQKPKTQNRLKINRKLNNFWPNSRANCNAEDVSEERTASDPWRDFATKQNTGFCNSKQLLITMYAVLHFCTASWIARMRILSFVTSAFFFFFCLRFVTFLVAFYALFFGFCCRKHSLNSHTFFTQFNIFSYYNEFLKSICIVFFGLEFEVKPKLKPKLCFFSTSSHQFEASEHFACGHRFYCTQKVTLDLVKEEWGGEADWSQIHPTFLGISLPLFLFVQFIKNDLKGAAERGAKSSAAFFTYNCFSCCFS